MLSDTVRKALRTFPAVLVTGARQSGKTTFLLQEFAGSHRYVSLERPEVRARAGADPIGFFEENPPPVILDEIQYAPELLHYVKDRIDADRRPGRWLLTGSQSFEIMRGVSQSLAGRVAVLRLEPLSISEMRRRPSVSVEHLLQRVFGTGRQRPHHPTSIAKPQVDLADWLLRGGFPEPRLHRRVDRQLWFSSYVATYLERDVRNLAQVGDLSAFGRFLLLVAARNGGLLNMADLGRDAGVTGPTAKHWLGVLEASHMVHVLQPYHRNFGKRVRKSPKLYITDPGLTTYLLGLHTREAVLQGPSLGGLVEAAVLGEWLKAFRCRGVQPPMFFWRSSNGQEVDLVIEYGGRLHAIEVKATATPTPQHAAGLARWLELAGPGARAALACRIHQPVGLVPGIRAVPWHLAW
jgi:predicted AAA+ superfamily ATPase